MSQFSTYLRALVPTSLLLLLSSASAEAASLVGPVNKADWGTGIPAHIEMYIGVPDNLPDNAPILVNIHSCGNSAGGQWGYAGFEPIRQAMESVGFIMIVPQQSRNCWDVGTTESLTHDGGGDAGAIVQMVQYVVDTYGADPSRVYAMGGSGGGMAVQALLAVYPEVFKGGHARAGVPAGCWAESYDPGQQWSGPCADGAVDKTPEEWGELVRAMNPSYSGPRPRIQINQGNVDETISFNNFGEAIDQWTNVLGLDSTPTESDSGFQGAEATYDRQFWQDACGYTVLETWEALGMGHSMGYESVHILEFFGLDQVREQDPWDEACAGFVEPEVGSGGAGGAGSNDSQAGGAGGTMNAAGGGPATPEPAPTGAAGGAGGGTTDAAGGAGTGTDPVSTPSEPGPADVPVPGNPVMGQMPVTPGVTPTATPGVVNPTPATGSTTPTPVAPSASASGTTGAANDGGGGSGDSGGCSFAPGSTRGGVFAAILFALGLVVTRRRRWEPKN